MKYQPDICSLPTIARTTMRAAMDQNRVIIVTVTVFFLRQISSLISMSSLLSPCLDDDLGKRVAVLGRNDFNYREALIGKYYSIPIIGDIINSTSLKSVDTSDQQAYQSLYETMQNQSVGERQTIYLIMK